MDIIEKLMLTQNETLQFFELSDQQLSLSYGENKWNVKQILHHLADAEMVLHERIKRTIARPNQTIQAFDQDAWCREMKYQSKPLSISQDLFSATRKSIIYLAENFYKSHGQNEYIHSETKKRTVKQEFDKVANHNEQHLRQIRQALKNG